ncbi:sugar ABC transporter permease [Paenibacillus antri]|uniref:Sugar ABC transporter permease n=1 Tax=Paenibacillus antri TaxID=2582848 RepID=A0A5R9GIG5_9BACL|nr:sugar ABC transporter permease [Paenibacillus antri]TLS52613.1 sugar ABC transporter permease [Paenibacillus antri]
MRRFGKMSMRTRHILEGYSFISLWVVGFLMFLAVPFGQSLYYSFNKMTLTNQGLVASFNGLAYYREAFTLDVEFVPKLMSTVTTMVVHVPLIIVFAMFSALLLNRPFRGRMLFRSIFFLPVIIASGMVLQKLLEQGAATLPIFVQYDLARILSQYVPGEVLLPLLRMADSLTLVMWDSGVQILIFLAGLQSISPSLYEAAKCDGATPWESFWKVTFPMITPMILVNILFSIVNSFTKVNNSVMQYIHTVAFKENDYGYGAALGWIYFAIIFAIILLVMLMFRRMDNPYTREGR